MIRRLLPGVILGLLPAGCAPQVIHEELEYRRLSVPELSPEKDSFRERTSVGRVQRRRYRMAGG